MGSRRSVGEGTLLHWPLVRSEGAVSTMGGQWVSVGPGIWRHRGIVIPADLIKHDRVYKLKKCLLTT